MIRPILKKWSGLSEAAFREAYLRQQKEDPDGLPIDVESLTIDLSQSPPLSPSISSIFGTQPQQEELGPKVPDSIATKLLKLG